MIRERVNGRDRFIGPIEKGVPAPAGNTRGLGALRSQLARLTVGASFVTTHTSTGCHSTARRLGMRVSTRQIEPGSEQIRVWRIE